MLAVRPERLQLDAGPPGQVIAVTLSDIVYAGAALLLIGRLPDGTEIRARIPGASQLSSLVPGDVASFTIPAEAMLLYRGKRQ